MQCILSSKVPSNDLRTSWSIIVKNAVRVLPDPVGEHRSKCSPSMMEGIASFCGSVKSGYLETNQSLTGWLKRSQSSSLEDCFSIYDIVAIFGSPFNQGCRQAIAYFNISTKSILFAHKYSYFQITELSPFSMKKAIS